MVSFISAFYHIYVLSSLFQPGTTMDITFFFIQQVQHKLNIHKALILETQSQTPTGNKSTDIALALQNKVNPRLIFQSIVDIATLLLRIFVLLCILLAISIFEIAQMSRQPISQSSNIKLNSVKTARNDTSSSATITPTSRKLEDSPRLLPTPPSEKCDSISLPMNCHAPIMKGNDDDTTVTPAPTESTPPDLKIEPKQQQTMPILNDTNNANPDNNDENMHHHKAALFKSQPDHLPNDQVASADFADNQDVAHKDGTTTTTATALSEPVSDTILPSSDIDSPIEPITTQDQQSLLSSPIPQQKDGDEIPVNEPTPAASEMPDHAPKPSPSPSSSTHDTKRSSRNIHDDEKPSVPPVPYLPPPLTPSASLSSSLSTLAHTHSNNNYNQEEKATTANHQHEQQQQQQQQQQQKLDEDHHAASRLHQVYLEKQHQPTFDPIAPLPRPYSSYSTRTHHSETPAATTSNSPPLPQPQGSSLSMKLNKLKKPGRRISQLFKKKSNKNKAADP